jgi:hypothetical protein
MGVTKTQSAKWQKLASLPDEKFEIRVEHAKARVEGMTTSAPNYTKAEYTGENEWFTPADWIERTRHNPSGAGPRSRPGVGGKIDPAGKSGMGRAFRKPKGPSDLVFF